MRRDLRLGTLLAATKLFCPKLTAPARESHNKTEANTDNQTI